MANFTVGVANIVTVVSSILLAVVSVFGVQFAANDYRAGHGLTPLGTPLTVWFEAAALPVGLILLFVIPSALLLRRGWTLSALTAALLPAVPITVLLGFLFVKMS